MVLKRNVRGGVPSPYPRFLFHGLRCAQLVSSMTVGAVMLYFMYYLRLEKIRIPWTFILLLTVSLFTLAALLVTILFYNFTYLSPRFNLVLNGGCGLLWGLGLGLLSWSISISNVLGKACEASAWNGQEAAAAVCRDYKALWSMTLVATVSTVAALLLDIKTQTKVNKRGVYNRPEDDKEAKKLDEQKTPQMRAAGYDAPGNSEWTSDYEQDIGYHNRYGADEVEAHDPLGEVSYSGRSVAAFRD